MQFIFYLFSFVSMSRRVGVLKLLLGMVLYWTSVTGRGISGSSDGWLTSSYTFSIWQPRREHEYTIVVTAV